MIHKELSSMSYKFFFFINNKKLQLDQTIKRRHVQDVKCIQGKKPSMIS